MVRLVPPRVERVIIAKNPGPITDLYEICVQYGASWRYVGYLKRSHRITVVSDTAMFALPEVRQACTRFHNHYQDNHEQANESRIEID